MRTRALLALLLLLPGCTLVDQTTFNPNAGKRPVIPPAPVPPVAPPVDPAALMTINFPPPASLPADIEAAVKAARARKPDVVFDVVEITGGVGNGPLGANAEAVGQLITQQHVPPNRVHLILRGEPGASGNQVRVYVR